MKTTLRMPEFLFAWALLGLRTAAIGIAGLLHGCTTQTTVAPESSMETASTPAPPPPPPPVAPELGLRIQAAMAGRLSMTMTDLMAYTHIEQLVGLSSDKTVYLFRLEGRPCAAGNCAYALFTDERGQLQELYYGLLASAPRVMPERHFGYAELVTTAVIDDSQLRTARLRWDGNDFVEVSCLLVSRVTTESRPCASVTHTQIVAEPRIPPQLCEQVKSMLSRPLKRIQTQTMMSNSFLVRGDADHHVEAIKVQGNVAAKAKRALIDCTRSRGRAEQINLADSAAADGSDLPTRAAQFRVRGAEVSAVDLTFGMAYFKRDDVTLLTVGVSTVPLGAR